MELLLKLTPAGDIQRHVLPMLYRGLDADSPQIHELCLAVLPTFAGLLDHSNVKNSLLPRIKKLCLNTSTLSVRVNCLLCVGRLLEHLDKWLVIDEILPFLPQIPSREPAVLMGILGIYKLALHHKKLGITKEIIASRVLPFLIPLCIENGLSIPQFNALTTLVKEMFQIVETEHRTKLEQLNTVKDEQKMLANTMPVVSPKTKPIELDTAFSGLGLDNFVPGMNIQQKQNLAQQQESFKAFSEQPAIQPKKVDGTPKSVPKDLSSSLLDDWVSKNTTSLPTPDSQGFHKYSNATSSLMALSNAPTNQITSTNASKMFGNASRNSFNNNQMMLTSPQSPSSNSQWGSQTNWNTSLTQSNTPLMGASNFSNNNAGANQWSNSQGGNSQNWSAFDTLLPSGNGNSGKVPMNKVGVQNVPLIPSASGNSVNNNKKGLSKDDIMDFLS